MDFGNWIDGSQDTGHPYIQLASVTNAAQARDDFVKARLSGVDSTNDSQWALLPVEQMQHSPVSEEEKKKKYQEWILSRWPYILTGCLVFVLVVLGLCIWRCCCRKGKKNTNAPKRKSKGLFSQQPESTAYLPLQEQGKFGAGSHGATPPYSASGSYGGGGHGFTGHSHA